MRKEITLVILLLLVGVSSLISQINTNQPLTKPEGQYFPELIGVPAIQPPFVNNMTKIPGHYSAADWQAVIDATWGTGLPTADKLAIFDNFWNTIDQKFACFHNHDINWDSIKTLYRPQVAAGCSRGRFQAIMDYMSLALKEAHTSASDSVIIYTPITAGLPVLYLGAWGGSGGIGAGLTMLPDSTSLVYEVIPNHPLGLVPGDIVLGYDGIPWKTLVLQLISYQLPLRGMHGSSPNAFIHSLINCVGMNWHLFDTIDIKKFNTGEIVHLSTAPLQNQTTSIIITEQMTISGVVKPDIRNGQEVSYGVYPGTNIGYIYGIRWGTPSKAELFNAVNNLLKLNPDGLIFDYRTNFGGGMLQGDSAFKLLYPNAITYTDYGIRSNTRKHTQMTPVNLSSLYTIPGMSPGYNKPIAVLTGPGAVSSGDQVSLRMKYHPKARTFGKSTNGAFNGPVSITTFPGWFIRYAHSDFYELKTPGVYLTHVEFPVDEKVWLTPSMVAQGRDDVVEAALNWINASNAPGVTVFEDNAESGLTKWTTTQGWNTIAKYPKSPVNSFTDSPLGNYANSANNALSLKDPLNVSEYNTLSLSFWHRYATQSGKDYCRVEVSTNNGTTWSEIKNYSGTLSTMTLVELDITSYANKSSNFKIRFRLTSDSKTVADGWYLDDIKIVGKTTGKNLTDNQSNNNIPEKYSLSQNYPNPFNPVTKISFDVPKQTFVSLKIYDMLGREVRTLLSEVKSPGTYSIDFNGAEFSSGIYFYRLQSAEFTDVKRMTLIK